MADGSSGPSPPQGRPAYEHVPNSYSEPTWKDRFTCQKIFLYGCCCFLVTIVLVIIAGVTLFLVLQPKKPSVSIQKVELNNLNITFYDGNSTLSDITAFILNDSIPLVNLNAEINVTVLVENPNKVSFRLIHTSLETYYKNASLATTEVPSFKVGAGKHKDVEAFIQIDIPISSGIANSFLQDYLNSSVLVKTKVPLRGGIQILGVSSPVVKVNLVCYTMVDIPNKSIFSNNCEEGEFSL